MIIDSDILINASHGQSSAVDFLIQSGNSETLYITVISHLELIAGARDKTELRRVEKFLSRFVLITLDDASSRRAVDLMRQYKLSHGMALPDALIAAAALERGETLATSNTRDFIFIKGLKLATP